MIRDIRVTWHGLMLRRPGMLILLASYGAAVNWGHWCWGCCTCSTVILVIGRGCTCGWRGAISRSSSCRGRRRRLINRLWEQRWLLTECSTGSMYQLGLGSASKIYYERTLNFFFKSTKQIPRYIVISWGIMFIQRSAVFTRLDEFDQECK